MEVKVKKLTDVALLRKANSFTTGKGSVMTLEKAYKLGHSPSAHNFFGLRCTTSLFMLQANLFVPMSVFSSFS